MQSNQSKFIEKALGAFGSVRSALRTKDSAVKKLSCHEKRFRISPTTAHKYGVSQGTISGVPVCSMGSGDRCIMYLHGGTYVDPPTILHWRMLHTLAAISGWRIVVPIYSRVPAGCADTTVASMYDVYGQLQQDDSISTIVVMGDSAGGGLALALCEYILYMGGVQPAKLLLLSPWLDIEMKHPDIDKYVACDKLLRVSILRDYGSRYANNTQLPWLASPIGNITKGLAPIELFVGSCELFLPDCLLAKQLADQQGVEMKLYEFSNMQHVFALFPIPEAQEILNMIKYILEDII